jgi:hypothetical protein
MLDISHLAGDDPAGDEVPNTSKRYGHSPKETIQMYKLNLMLLGSLSPKLEREDINNEKLHIWKCNVNKYGIITSCKLIRENCDHMGDLKGLRHVFYNFYDLFQYVNLCEKLKREARS